MALVKDTICEICFINHPLAHRTSHSQLGLKAEASARDDLVLTPNLIQPVLKLIY